MLNFSSGFIKARASAPPDPRQEIVSTNSHFDRIPGIRRVDPGKK
jgi:hypothetical protein